MRNVCIFDLEAEGTYIVCSVLGYFIVELDVPSALCE